MGALSTPATTHASQPVKEDFSVTTTTPISTPDSPQQLIRKAADKYGVSYTKLYNTLKCESAGFQNIQSLVPHKGQPNGREDSWGISQIYLPAHKEVTRAQALDPEFAIDFAAKGFSEGHIGWWVCARNLGYTK